MPLAPGGVRLKPGKYTLVISAPGHTPLEVPIQASAGQTIVVPADLAPVASPGPSGLRIAAWLTASAGGAALVTGLVLTLLSQTSFDDATTHSDGVATLTQVDTEAAIDPDVRLRRDRVR